MTTYIVTFDVKNKTRLSTLKGVLKSYGLFCPIHENAWAIRVEKTASEIRDELMKYTVLEDRIFVIRTGTESAWKNSYGEKNNEWLKKYL